MPCYERQTGTYWMSRHQRPNETGALNITVYFTRQTLEMTGLCASRMPKEDTATRRLRGEDCRLIFGALTV